MPSDTPSISNLETAPETTVPSLLDLADEPSSGVWEGQGFGPNKNWYPAKVVEGYATRNGTQFQTEDTPSQKGDSRNLRLCLTVTNNRGETRNTFDSQNYRMDDLTPERIAAVKEARTEFKGVKGKWPVPDLQRSSLALASLGALERAFGFSLRRTEAGFLDASLFVGQQLDVRLGKEANDRGQEFNIVMEYAKSGERTSAKK